MLRNWIHTFVYNVKENKFFTALNIIGLAIGVACIVFATLYWNDEKSYDKWNPEKDNVYAVYVGTEGVTWAYVPAPFDGFIKEMPEVKDHCFYYNYYGRDLVTYNGKSQMTDKITGAMPNFFSFFPFEFIHGNPETALSPGSVALEEKTAKSIFGEENPIGKTIEVGNSGETLTVNGVYRIPGNSSVAPNLIYSDSVTRHLKRDYDRWGNYSFGLLVKPTSSEDANNIGKKMKNIIWENRYKEYAKKEGFDSIEAYEEARGKVEFGLQSLANARLHSVVDGAFPEGKGNYQFLMIMIGISVLILILSVVNYINLATAGAIRRAKEVGVRKVLGASKGNIVLQYIFETLLISVFSIVLALSIVELTLPYYNILLDKTLTMRDTSFYFQITGVLLLVVLVAGVFPALYVSNFNTIKVLRGNFGRSKNGVWLRNTMLVLQLSIASFFIIGSYVVYQQVNFLANKELGFKGDQVIRVNFVGIGSNISDFNERIKFLQQKSEFINQELPKIQGVKGATLSTFSFGNGASSSSGYTYNNNNIQGQNIAIDFNTFSVLSLEVVKGRGISPEFASDTINNVLVNETAVRLMQEKDPIGKEIGWNDNKLKIIGVVKDFSLNSPQSEIPPMTFFHLKTIDWLAYNLNSVYIKLDGENIQETIGKIEDFWKKNVENKYPFEYDFVNKEYARTYAQYTHQKNLFAVLNILVILIALFGLFSLASYSIQRRMKGIAIRKTLGAETQQLLLELSRQYIVFSVIGFVIAIFPVYYLLTLWLENFSYRIDISWFPFVIGFVVLLVLTLVVVLSKAYQATRVDMLKYLKYE